MVNISDLDVIFNPKTIAVVGARRSEMTGGWPGPLGCVLQFGFKGRAYPINPKADEIYGLKCYPDLVSVPEPIDLVIVSLPAPAVPDALRDCVASGNKNVYIFTAGFKETGEAQGIALQNEIEEIAKNGGLNVIGPNGMGLFVPKSRLVTWNVAPKQHGSIAFVSQSGSHAQAIVMYGEQFNVHFSKVISYGNALTLDSTDFLEYLAEDPETSIITMYLEGVKDARKLLDIVREINKKKPVIILKAGLTESGTRACASHTGSLAGQEQFWNAFFKQTGAVRVETLEDIVHTAMALQNLDPPKGRGVVVLGTGGGVGVNLADTCSRAGLEMPPLDKELQKKLRTFIDPAGTMINNPVDAYHVFAMLNLMPNALQLFRDEPYLDMMIMSLQLDWLGDIAKGEHASNIADFIANEARKYLKGMPLVVCCFTSRNEPELNQTINMVEQKLLKANVPVYKNFQQAADSLVGFANYHKFIQETRE